MLCMGQRNITKTNSSLQAKKFNISELRNKQEQLCQVTEFRMDYDEKLKNSYRKYA